MKPQVKSPALPGDILKSDLIYPPYTEGSPKHVYDKDFEIWYTERFG